MELRKAADALLRSQSSPLTRLLNPSSISRATGAHIHYRTANRPTQRLLSSSARHNAVKPEATTSATPARDGSSKSPDTVDEISKSLWASPSSRAGGSLSLDAQKRMNNGDSAFDILNAISSLSKPKPSARFDPGAMLNPSAPLDNRSIMETYAQGGHLAMPSTPRAPMRLRPSTGRSVTIGTGIDVARGLRLLEQSCARNRVRSDATQQRFHERGGLKKKRLRRQRWRKRFLEGFQATVGRVRELKNQGW
ncbi:hypothetical protein D0Z07_4278 [Hyphodiscus hymeniophilus]|uniref:Ribosomal protein S21 n=1 Tax=Hyphodiscus hymeniophilus TaxID=353542 RepID=A0A9P6VJT9_9HELO|nr:hypothetical protein D0Z07_4278 [Hyphodiscus hymeniophilus]